YLEEVFPLPRFALLPNCRTVAWNRWFPRMGEWACWRKGHQLLAKRVAERVPNTPDLLLRSFENINWLLTTYDAYEGPSVIGQLVESVVGLHSSTLSVFPLLNVVSCAATCQEENAGRESESCGSFHLAEFNAHLPHGQLLFCKHHLLWQGVSHLMD